MIILLIFAYQISGFKVKSKSKAKSRLQTRSRNNKSTIKNLKKNGPLSWEVLTDDKVLEQLINDNSPKSSRTANTPFSQTINPSFIQNQVHHTIKSENQKSNTFRTVGPNENTTIDNNGQKYSSLFIHRNGRKMNSGYYGKSRLTR
jgi:hypothetical protein